MTRVVVIATGGTIATSTDQDGIARPTRSATDLVGGLGTGVQVDAVDLMSVDSSELTPADWDRIGAAVLAARDADGIVITHGTDTLEETAWFLHLVLHGDKPVVMTAAMRPATALSADGPMNLWEAVQVACCPAFHGPGVLIAVGGEVFDAADFAKCHTIRPAAFCAPLGGPLGLASPPVRLRGGPMAPAAVLARGALEHIDTLPWVEVLHIGAGADPRLLDLLREAGVAGVVLALPGNGSLPDAWLPAVARAADAKVRLVRASRVLHGPVTARAQPGPLTAAGFRSALQARIVLMLALATGDDGLLATCAPAPG